VGRRQLKGRGQGEARRRDREKEERKERERKKERERGGKERRKKEGPVRQRERCLLGDPLLCSPRLRDERGREERYDSKGTSPGSFGLS